IASYSFVQFLFNPILGRISDKHGRKPVIVVCLFINAIGYVIFAFTSSFAVLLLSRIVGGVGGSSVSVAQAYIADVTTKETRSKGMGVIGAAFGLGFVFGPLMGGLLSSYGYTVTGLGSASFSLLAFIVTIILLPESNQNKQVDAVISKKLINFEAYKKVFSNPALAILISLFFVLTFSFANIYGTFALLGIQVYGFTDLQNGYILGILGLTSAAVQGGLIGHLDKLLGKKKILIIGSFFMMVGLAIMPYAGNFLKLAIDCVALSIGTGIFQPTVLSLISQNASDEEQGLTFGVNQSMSAIGRVLGPLWGGFAFEFLGYPFPFITGAAFTFLILLATILYIPRKIKFE
ncbi:MAG: MFS transporter, partial [Ignavibacteriaceae bacterium]